MALSVTVAPEARPQYQTTATTMPLDARWRPLARLAAWAALIQVALIVVQIPVYLLYPPPTTVAGFFALLQRNPLLGLLNLDLLMLANAILFFPILLALYVSLRRDGETTILLALTIGLVANALCFAWNGAFTMLALSGQHATAMTEAERGTVLAAGQAVLTTHLSGTAFDVYYVLSGVVFILIGAVMVRGVTFGRATGYTAITTGLLTLVPPTIGTVGLYLSLLALVPLSVWFIQIARQFFRLGRRDAIARASA